MARKARKGKKRGAKSKLTDSVIKKVLSYKGQGYTDKTLSNLIKVRPETFSRWKTKGLTAKTGRFRQFRQALESDEAALEVRVVNPWMMKIDQGDMKAIELALRRMPSLRTEFKEEKTETDVKMDVEATLTTLSRLSPAQANELADIIRSSLSEHPEAQQRLLQALKEYERNDKDT